MSLERYVANKWIREHETSAQEIRNLFAIADRDIEQSQTPGLGPEWRFDIAYNAVVQSATAGFRPERANKHMRVLECLEFTIQLDKEKVLFLDKCRRKRNAAVYEQVGVISDQEADEMIEEAIELRARVGRWIEEEHSSLLP